MVQMSVISVSHELLSNNCFNLISDDKVRFVSAYPQNKGKVLNYKNVLPV